MNDLRSVTFNDISGAQEKFSRERANIVAEHAVTSSGLRAAARNPLSVALATSTFDIQLKQGQICNQKQSGRCWMFASLNLMRNRVMNKLGLKSYELSQAYPLFWDKLERCNWFFENILNTADAELSSREVNYLLSDPIGDGGQWDMFAALVKKYGVVPKEAMPETFHSSCTRDMNKYLTRFLRYGAKELRNLQQSGAGEDALLSRKKELMDQVYTFLVICLGEPPRSFDVRIRDDKNELKASGTYTPQEFFAEFVDMDVDQYVSLINSPTQDKPFMQSYTVKFLGNLVEAGGVRYINLPIERLKQVAVAQLNDGEAVWFGSDVDQCYLREEGVMDPAGLDVDGLFGMPIEAGLSKAERLDFGESLMTHAMVLQGVNLDCEQPTRWLIENSWGEDRGHKGYDIATDDWFSEYVYQVVVNKKYLTDEERAAFEAKPVELAPWDPMGSLA